MCLHYEHKPLECPNCKSKNVLKVITTVNIITTLLTSRVPPSLTLWEKVWNGVKRLLRKKIEDRIDYEKLLRSNKQESRSETEELLRNNEAVVYDGDNYVDTPAWQCTACNAYFFKDDYPPVRYVFVEKPIECPVCHSKRIANIQYGEPSFDKELRNQEIKGEIIIGGCCVEADYPAWRCYDCEQNLHAK